MTGTVAGIVVGVDRSAAGRAAMRWALREALAGGASLTAVRARQMPAAGSSYVPGGLLPGVDPKACAEAQQLADEQLERGRQEVPGADAVDGHGSAVMGAVRTGPGGRWPACRDARGRLPWRWSPLASGPGFGQLRRPAPRQLPGCSGAGR